MRSHKLVKGLPIQRHNQLSTSDGGGFVSEPWISILKLEACAKAGQTRTSAEQVCLTSWSGHQRVPL